MGKPLLGLILINRIRASRGSCNHPDGLSPRKRKSAESVIIGINKSVKSAKSVVFITCECILFKTDTGVYD